jgi:hypothetical protein
MLPQEELFRINVTCRENDIAFVMAINTGVTVSMFSDFGIDHAITDTDGEPTTTMAMSALEVLQKPPLLKVSGVEDGEDVVVITVATAKHGLDDGDAVTFDDMSGGLAALNGKTCKVKRLAFKSPTEAKLDLNSVGTLNLLKESTATVLDSFQKQYAYYKGEFDKNDEGNNKKFAERELTLFSRFALDFSDGNGDARLDLKGLPFGGESQSP